MTNTFDFFDFGQLSIDVAAYGSQGSAVLGIRDSGKTYTATLLAEKLHGAGVPFVAFDPVGVWRYLRVPGPQFAPMPGKGIPVVVAGGVDGDIPLDPGTAADIVEAAMAHGISLVIDLFSIELTKADWRRIVRDSVRTLLHSNRRHGLRHIFIEEAAEFIPQKVTDGLVYAEVEKLARMGGNAGLGYTLINQRAEEVNKAVLELCDNLFLHRQKGRNSLTALGKWLDVGNVSIRKEIVSSMATLPTGQCWAWLAGTPEPVLVKVPKKQSMHPDRRMTRGGLGDATIQARAVDVGQFVATLKALLAPKKAPAAATVDGTVTDDGAYAAGQEAGRRERDPEVSGLRQEVQGLRAALDAICAMAAAGTEAAASEVADPVVRTHPADQGGGSGGLKPRSYTDRAMEKLSADLAALPQPSRAGARARAVPKMTGNGTLSAGARKLQGVLVQRATVWLTWGQVATLAGLAPRGGSFNTARAQLRATGHLEEEGGNVRITPDQAAKYGAPMKPMRAAELVDMWVARLPRPAARVLRTLYEGGASTKADVAARLDVQPHGGSWNSAIATLRRNQLIVEEYGRIRLADVLGGKR